MKRLRFAAPVRGGLRPSSATDGAVDHLPDEVGVAVVAGVLLDHVGVNPAQGHRFAAPEPGVREVVGGGGPPARLALGLPDGQVGVPICPV